MAESKRRNTLNWIARVLVLAVFIGNMQCALLFILHPQDIVGAYQIAGSGAEPVARSIGISFLLWNCTYPAVIWNPERFRSVFVVVLAQQAVGLLCEIWLYTTLDVQTAQLADSIMRFIWFDAPAFIAMIVAFLISRPRPRPRAKS